MIFTISLALINIIFLITMICSFYHEIQSHQQYIRVSTEEDTELRNTETINNADSNNVAQTYDFV